MQRTVVLLSLFAVSFGEDECTSYDGSDKCSWTKEWSCPSQPAGSKGTATSDNSPGYECCCNQKMWKTMPKGTTKSATTVAVATTTAQAVTTATTQFVAPVVVATTTGQVVTTAATTVARLLPLVAATTTAQVTTTVAPVVAVTTPFVAPVVAATTTAQAATTAATTALVATTVQVVTTTGSANIYAVTSLIAYASAGGHIVWMANTAGFVYWMDITIDATATNEETVRIVGFKDGAVLVSPPLAWGHNVNAIVQAAGPWAHTSTYTPGAPPVAKNAVGEVQQKLAGVPNPLLVIGLFLSAAIIAVVFRARRRNSHQSGEFQVLEPSDSECALE